MLLLCLTLELPQVPLAETPAQWQLMHCDQRSICGLLDSRCPPDDRAVQSIFLAVKEETLAFAAGQDGVVISWATGNAVILDEAPRNASLPDVGSAVRCYALEADITSAEQGTVHACKHPSLVCKGR